MSVVFSGCCGWLILLVIRQKLSGGGPLSYKCKQNAPPAVRWSDLVRLHAFNIARIATPYTSAAKANESQKPTGSDDCRKMPRLVITLPRAKDWTPTAQKANVSKTPPITAPAEKSIQDRYAAAQRAGREPTKHQPQNPGERNKARACLCSPRNLDFRSKEDGVSRVLMRPLANSMFGPKSPAERSAHRDSVISGTLYAIVGGDCQPISFGQNTPQTQPLRLGHDGGGRQPPPHRFGAPRCGGSKCLQLRFAPLARKW